MKTILEFLINKPIMHINSCEFDLYKSTRDYIYIILNTEEKIRAFLNTEIGNTWKLLKEEEIPGIDEFEFLKNKIYEKKFIFVRPANPDSFGGYSTALISYSYIDKKNLHKKISCEDFSVEYWKKNKWKL